MDPPESLPGAEPDSPPAPQDVDAAVLLLGAGVTAATHPLLYVKLLIQVAARAAGCSRGGGADTPQRGRLAPLVSAGPPWTLPDRPPAHPEVVTRTEEPHCGVLLLPNAADRSLIRYQYNLIRNQQSIDKHVSRSSSSHHVHRVCSEEKVSLIQQIKVWDLHGATAQRGGSISDQTSLMSWCFCLICVLQVGHEPLPPAVGTTMFGRRVLYLPGFFSYAQHIMKVDGKRGLFSGLSPRILSSAISTVVRSKVKQFLQQVELLSKKDDAQSSLRKVVKETSHEMIIQCLSRVATHPFHVISVRCMAQFVGREVKYGGMFSCIVKIFKEEGIAGFYVGLVPHMVGEVLFLWCCNLLAHFINTYAVDESFSQASAVRSYTKFVMGIAVSVLTYPFMLVADLMAVNNCGLAAGLPPHSPIFKSWLHCWTHLSEQVPASPLSPELLQSDDTRLIKPAPSLHVFPLKTSPQGHLFRGSSFFFRRVPVTSLPSIDD
ncbi:hypothetical protein L3Q82_015504 [Scortum barcoo]|uniref:Uncharacterized protein n=1 Tax=Scortum barcoo TaxID=214431 RepID=A0ACB8VPW6_9TELE|nr:hypothetical protein L3Q82_015504 [Scortum barcoo]